MREYSRRPIDLTTIWMFPKIVVAPNHPLKNSVFHYFHIHFGVFPLFFGNTLMCKKWPFEIEFRCSKMRMKFYDNSMKFLQPGRQLRIKHHPFNFILPSSLRPLCHLPLTASWALRMGWLFVVGWKNPMKMSRFMMLNDTLEDIS